MTAGAAESTFPRQLVCQTIADAAAANGLPASFLARLLWTESGFRSSAISPAGAIGVAQFMPQTAIERGLSDPRDPLQAIYHAASLLIELDRHFGNLGLAAAAYNAGAARVTKWLLGQSGLPMETEVYVRTITGRRAEDWATMRGTLAADDSFPLPGLDCLNLSVAQAKDADPVLKPTAWRLRLELASSHGHRSICGAFTRRSARFGASPSYNARLHRVAMRGGPRERDSMRSVPVTGQGTDASKSFASLMRCAATASSIGWSLNAASSNSSIIFPAISSRFVVIALICVSSCA